MFIHGLNLDWKRFVTYQTTEFMKNEIVPLRELTPDIPVTTNLMGTYPGFDPWYLTKYVDVVSWDSYPDWHNDYESFADTAMKTAFLHDLNRSLKHKPFILMESTPSQVNWQCVNKLKRPGVHELTSMQAVAHGSDSVQYFQWRKGRGASEKFHGAVVDHYGKEDTRVFQEVAKLGAELEKLNEIPGTYTKSDVALIYDWDNRWAIDDLQGLNDRRKYEETCKKHYQMFWEQGINVDVNTSEEEFTPYKLVVAPMLYLLKPGVAKRLKTYVKNGGTLVLTLLTGNVDQSDRCFLGGFPGDGLREVAGIWAEEIDPLYESDRNGLVLKTEHHTGYTKDRYECMDFCEVIHPDPDTKILAEYESDFYQGMAAVTEHMYGVGRCYYIAARTEESFLRDFYGNLTAKLELEKPPVAELPEGVSVTKRSGNEKDYYFIMNYSEKECTISFAADFIGRRPVKLSDGMEVEKNMKLEKYGYLIVAVSSTSFLN